LQDLFILSWLRKTGHGLEGDFCSLHSECVERS